MLDMYIDVKYFNALLFLFATVVLVCVDIGLFLYIRYIDQVNELFIVKL